MANAFERGGREPAHHDRMAIHLLAADRRVKRLYLKKAGRALLGKMSGLKSELTANALDGISPADAHRLLTQLESIKENVRNAIQTSGAEQARKEQRYG